MIGSIIGIATLLFALWASTSGENLALYFQVHSLALVGLGTLGVLFVTSTPKTILASLMATMDVFKSDQHFSDSVEDLRKLSKNRYTALAKPHALISYGQQLWEQGTDPELFIVLLSEKKNELESKGIEVIHNLKNLSKYPPALGMVGTVLGMISLFSALDKNQERIGEALATAMSATLLGLILSNFLISPLADRLHVRHFKDKKTLTAIYEVLLLINSSEPFEIIEEEVLQRAA
jgi:chemotaxis protein MotA